MERNGLRNRVITSPEIQRNYKLYFHSARRSKNHSRLYRVGVGGTRENEWSRKIVPKEKYQFRDSVRPMFVEASRRETRAYVTSWDYVCEQSTCFYFIRPADSRLPCRCWRSIIPWARDVCFLCAISICWMFLFIVEELRTGVIR